MFRVQASLPLPTAASLVMLQRLTFPKDGHFETMCGCRTLGILGRHIHLLMWRNWQTRQTQNLLVEISCEFNSHREHHYPANKDEIRPVSYVFVAQMVEQQTFNLRVGSSSLPGRTNSKIIFCIYAVVAELADARDLKSLAGNSVRVQVPSAALYASVAQLESARDIDGSAKTSIS